MILPDVNILVYAFRADTPEHERYATWLGTYVADGGLLALSDAVLAGFVRIVTHPRIMNPPAPTDSALAFVRWLADSPGAHWLSSSPIVWREFEGIVSLDRGVRGNLVPGAYLAALCVAHGATLATADRDFARFERLRRLDPA